jgi:hypothetical protein
MKKRIHVYRVIRDQSFNVLEPVKADDFQIQRLKSWRFDASKEHHDSWVELELRPASTGLPSPDIWEVAPGVIALEHSAYYELCSSAEETQEGYMHFAYCEGRRLAIVNSTYCVDALVKSQSVLDADHSKILIYAFDGTKLDISLFKIPETKETELLALDAFDEDNDFKTLVALHSFTGVQFEHLWSGESFMNAY